MPYDHDAHWRGVAGGVNTPFDAGYVMEYRNHVGQKFDLTKKKRDVESVLNGHKCKLILDGCAKGASCGWRVSVVFNVELVLGLNDASDIGRGKKIHKSVYLFPQAARADGKSWGENEDQPSTNVIAHECGHLFNYPDEYWEYGGWVHCDYIKNNELDFVKGDGLKGREVWQISSDKNVMGGGCNNVIPLDSSLSPSATVHPYYLEYIRRHFHDKTGLSWRIGYGS